MICHTSHAFKVVLPGTKDATAGKTLLVISEVKVRREGCMGSWWGKPEGKRPLGRPRRRWVDNIGIDLQEVGCGYMDWIGLAQDRDRWRTVVSAVMNLRVP